MVWACHEKRGTLRRKEGYGNESTGEKEERKTLSRPQVDACVLAFLRNRGNWNTQAHTGRSFVDYAAHSKNIRVSEQLGTLGR